jgi:protein gp37
MGANTGISWTDHTFNPWTGCQRVSAACDNCYAAGWADRFRPEQKLWEIGSERRRTAEGTWRKPRAWNEKSPGTVFCASLADVFDNKAPDAWRQDLWALVRATPNLLWLLLSKRPQNIRKMLPPDWPLPNAWLGVTAEDRTEAQRRVPILAALPAAGRVVSVEPMLEPVDLSPWLDRLSFVIAGCESEGTRPGARETQLGWVRSLRDQCAGAGVAFHLKQLALGGRLVHLPELDGRCHPERPHPAPRQDGLFGATGLVA